MSLAVFGFGGVFSIVRSVASRIRAVSASPRWSSSFGFFLSDLAMIPSQRLQREFHRALGHAITSWQHVETGLYTVLHCCLGTKHEHTSLVFFHIQSADSKVLLVERLCKVELEPKVFTAHWKPLKKSLDNDIKLRNALAHFEMAPLRAAPRGTEFPIALMPHALDVGRQKDGSYPALYVEQLHTIADEYHLRARELEDFARRHLPGWPQHAGTLPPELRRLYGLRSPKT